jgi:hypothetical protein
MSIAAPFATMSLPYMSRLSLVANSLLTWPVGTGVATRSGREFADPPAPPRPSVLPNRAFVDVISRYPGGLTPEDLLAKVENQLLAAELSGIPYTGVLIDGIHNVFVQFPILEQDATVWPQLFNLLRRPGITVVTTHTEFELHAHSLSVDFEHAQRKSAPLLSVIVSGADYVFELAGYNASDGTADYQLSIKGMLGEDPPVGGFEWDRQRLRIKGPVKPDSDDQLLSPLGSET